MPMLSIRRCSWPSARRCGICTFRIFCLRHSEECSGTGQSGPDGLRRLATTPAVCLSGSLNSPGRRVPGHLLVEPDQQPPALAKRCAATGPVRPAAASRFGLAQAIRPTAWLHELHLHSQSYEATLALCEVKSEEPDLSNKNKGWWRTVRDSNPRDGFPPTHFPGVRLRPLGQLSVRAGIAQGRA